MGMKTRRFEMINIEYVENPDDEIYQLIDNEFNQYAAKK